MKAMAVLKRDRKPEARMRELLLLQRLEYWEGRGVVRGEAAPSADHILGTAGNDVQAGETVIDLGDSDEEGTRSWGAIDIDWYVAEEWEVLVERAVKPDPDASTQPALVVFKREPADRVGNEPVGMVAASNTL